MIQNTIEFFINFFQNDLVSLGGWGVFLITFLAQVIPPISTPAILFIAGILFLPETFSGIFVSDLIFVIAFPAAFGVTIGSLMVYYIGYFVGKPFLEKWGKYIGLSWEAVEKLEKKFDKTHWDEVALFVLRSIPILPTVLVSFTCGLVRFSLRPYLIFTFLGTFVKVLMLSTLGWQVGVVYDKYAGILDGIEKAGLLIAVVVTAGFFVWMRFYKKNSNKNLNKYE